MAEALASFWILPGVNASQEVRAAPARPVFSQAARPFTAAGRAPQHSGPRRSDGQLSCRFHFTPQN